MLESNMRPKDPGRSKSFQPTSRQLLQAMEAMANIGFCTLTFADARVQCSDGVHMMAGSIERIGQPVDLSFIEAHTHPDDRASLIESFHLLMRDMLPRNRTMRLVRSDGTVRNLEMRFERMVDDQSRPTGWIICVLDQSEPESLRRSLALTRYRLRAALGQIDADVTWFGSLDGMLADPTALPPQHNHASAALMGTAGWLHLIHPDDQKTALADHGTLDPVTSVLRVAISPDQFIPVRTIRVPVEDETGAVLEWLGMSSSVETDNPSDARDTDSDEDLLTGPVLRAARNLLDWTIPVLAKHSEVSPSTIMRIEENSATVGTIARRSTLNRLTAALTVGGVVFHRIDHGKLAISL